jgi:hypothetical protein
MIIDVSVIYNGATWVAATADGQYWARGLTIEDAVQQLYLLIPQPIDGLKIN